MDDIREQKENERVKQNLNPFANVILEEPKLQKSERAQLNFEIYQIYTSPTQTRLRKKENWKRYIQFLKDNRMPDSTKAQAKFKRTKRFIKTHSKGSMAYLTSHLSKLDLRHCLSVGKDMDRRGENFSAWLLSTGKKT